MLLGVANKLMKIEFFLGATGHRMVIQLKVEIGLTEKVIIKVNFRPSPKIMNFLLF